VSTTRHRGTWTAGDRAEALYRYLPVDVPAHTNGLHVQLSYDRSAGVLDLGCEAPQSFRGWSGGARGEFTITRDAATPGYLAGELEAGAWNVVLGLHRIPPEGLDYEVVTQVYAGGATSVQPEPQRADPARPQRPPRRDLPSLDGLLWRAGDFHTHTVHSDGALTVPELATLAAQRGLDFLAVTDHNTVSHHAELGPAGRRAGIQLVAGQEVTTGFGHANAFGDVSWVDFRKPATAWQAAVEAGGGLLSVNHPLGDDCSWRHELPRRAPLAEVWHSSWLDTRWGGPLAWWLAWDQDVVPIGGSDFHRDPGARPGSPTTWVACEGYDVLGGLRARRVAISADRDGPLLLRLGDELVALGADGALLTGPDGRRRVVAGERMTFPAEPGPHWLEDHQSAVLAISA
jgi:PHP domain